MFKSILIVITIFYNYNLFANETALDNNLTNDELEYIKNNKFKCITTSNWEPFNLLEKNTNELSGIAIDYLKIIKQNTKLNIECQIKNPWSEVESAIKNKEADLTLSTTATNQRKQFAYFTKPYISYPIAFATNKDVPYIADISLLKNKKIAVGKNYSSHKILKENYPNLELVPVKDLDSALKLLSQDKVYAVADILPVVVYNINKNGYLNLKISGTTKYNFEVMIMVNKDHPKLVTILNKAIDMISQDQKKLIQNKWISVNFEKSIDYSIVWKTSLIFILILIFFYIKQKQLKKYNKELIEAKSAIKENLKSFETLLNSTIEGIIVFQKGVCIDANDVAPKIFGYESKQQMIGKGILEFISQSSKDVVSSKFKQKSALEYEAILIKKDGSEFPALLKGTNLKLNGKDIRVSSFIDLSSLKQKEKIIQEQSKMAALGEMLGNIAHQWRQPLNVISLGATGLKVHKELDKLTDENFYETCEKINSNVQYLSNTIDDFKNFIKGEHKLQKVNLKDIVNKSLNIVLGSLKSQSIEVIEQTSPNIEINTYPNELLQSLINILNNSADAFKEKNFDKDSEKFVFINLEQINNNAIITIKDNAGGIDENIMDKIFEPYFTTKHKSRGTGLGLNMTYNLIVNSMNGSLKASNESYTYKENNYKGASFCITIPIK